MKDDLITSLAHPQNGADCFDDWAYEWPGLKTGTWLIEPRREILELLERHIGSFAGTDILELGPNEGEITYLLETWGPRSVTSIECRSINFLKCLIVKNHYRLDRSTFLLGDFQQYLETTDCHFDTVLALGVLYHMTNPLALLSAIAKKSKHVVFDTMYWDREKLEVAAAMGHARWMMPPDNEYKATVDGFTCTYYGHNYDARPDNHKFGHGGVELGANFMTDVDILAALKHYGYTIMFTEYKDYPNGPHLWVAATLDPANARLSRRKTRLRKTFRLQK